MNIQAVEYNLAKIIKNVREASAIREEIRKTPLAEITSKNLREAIKSGSEVSLETNLAVSEVLGGSLIFYGMSTQDACDEILGEFVRNDNGSLALNIGDVQSAANDLPQEVQHLFVLILKYAYYHKIAIDNWDDTSQSLSQTSKLTDAQYERISRKSDTYHEIEKLAQEIDPDILRRVEDYISRN